MTRVVKPPPPPRPDQGLEAFVAWCASTQDLIAFQAVLRGLDEELWPTVLRGVVAALRVQTGDDGLPMGLADERAARGRTAARRHKLMLLERGESSRTPSGTRPKSDEPETAPPHAVLFAT